jgi:ubiquinone/menaquinone biosynthesis C-methylase UbiE
MGYFFDLAPVASSDVVYDLGSGDGRLLLAALERAAGKAVGIELNPELVNRSREKVQASGLEDRITILEADVMEVNLAAATILLCYLSTRASKALQPKFARELRPGTRVVMESFPLWGWKPAHIAGQENRQFYLYIMPPETNMEGETVGV